MDELQIEIPSFGVRVGLISWFVNTLGMRNRVAMCTRVMSRKFAS
jgi:hypothetical protein